MIQSGLRTLPSDKSAIARVIVSRAEVDMKEINVAYLRKYGMSIMKALEASLQASFQQEHNEDRDISVQFTYTSIECQSGCCNNNSIPGDERIYPTATRDWVLHHKLNSNPTSLVDRIFGEICVRASTLWILFCGVTEIRMMRKQENHNKKSRGNEITDFLWTARLNSYNIFLLQQQLWVDITEDVLQLQYLLLTFRIQGTLIYSLICPAAVAIAIGIKEKFGHALWHEAGSYVLRYVLYD